MYYIQRCDEYEGVECESYDTFGRSTVKIRRRAFVSCSRVKACNFSVFVNISSETVLEKFSPLNELRNYGDRWGKLGRVRKHQSHPAAPLQWLARKIFSRPVRSGQFERFWNWYTGILVYWYTGILHIFFLCPAHIPEKRFWTCRETGSFNHLPGASL